MQLMVRFTSLNVIVIYLLYYFHHRNFFACCQQICFKVGFIQIYLMHCFGKYSSQCFLNLNVLLFFLSLDSCKYILQYSNGKGSSSGEIYSLFVIFGKKFGQIMQYLSIETLFILHEKVATLNNSICIDLCFNV